MNSLPDWLKFLEEQWYALRALHDGLDGDQRIGKEDVGRIRVRDPEQWILADAFLCSAAIESAVRTFARDGRWPVLDGRTINYLMHRLRLAGDALLNLQGETPLVPMQDLPPRPRFEERSAFLHWLLVGVWNVEGEAHLLRWIKKTNATS